MRAIEQRRTGPTRRRKQQGVAAVEFSVVGIVFFLLFFGMVEMSRAMYVINTLQEVTRRAAALATNTDFSNAAAMQAVRQRAIFRDSPGFLLFAQPVNDTHIIIDYMWIQRSGGVMTMVAIHPDRCPQARPPILRTVSAILTVKAAYGWCACAYARQPARMTAIR